MAVQLNTSIHRYTGLASDDKPAPAEEDIPVGSIFEERDTGRVFERTERGLWVLLTSRTELLLERVVSRLDTGNATLDSTRQLLAGVRGVE